MLQIKLLGTKRISNFILGTAILLTFSNFAFGAVAPNGAFAYSIPIQAPPGISGVQPAISIDYNSSANGTDSYTGMSWSLSGLSEIRRVNTGKGIGFSGQDSYMSAEGLLIANGDGSYSSINQNFSRYVPQGQCGDSYCSWVVYLANGGVQFYGTTTDSRIVAPNSSGSVRTWAISKAQNSTGLYWEVEYDNYGDGNYYPLRISYTKGAGLYYHVIKFEYISRPDYFTQYSQSAAVSTTRLLSAVQTNSDCLIDYCLVGTKVSRWEFQYQQSRNFNVSKLVSYSKYGYDQNNNIDSNLTQTQTFSYDRDDLPIVQHSITGGSYLTTGFCAWVAVHYPNTGNCTEYFGGFPTNSGAMLLADIDGDGRQDLTRTSNGQSTIVSQSVRQYSNVAGFDLYSDNGLNWSTFPYAMPVAQTPFTIAGHVNRDLFTDFIGLSKAMVAGSSSNPKRLLLTTATSDAEGYLNGNGTYSPPNDFDGTHSNVPNKNYKYKYQLTSWVPYADGVSELFQISDIDGDGQGDIYYLFKLAGGQVRVNMLMSVGDGTFTERSVDSPLISTWDNATSNWQFGDFDGDGKGDLLLFTNQSGFIRANFAFSNGDGTFRYVTTDTILTAHWDNTNDVFRSADINADGKTDIFFITNSSGNAQINTLISKGNGQFQIVTHNTALTPTWNSITSLWLPADINGDGRIDLYFLMNVSGQLRISSLISHGNGNYAITSQDTGIYPYWNPAQERWFAADINGDGASDLYWVLGDSYPTNPAMRIYTIMSNFTKPLLTKIQDNNATINITYGIKADVPNAIQPALKACGLNQTGTVCGASNPIPQQLVVSESVTADGSTKSKGYEYSNARMFFGDILHTVNAGFEWIKQTDNQSGSTTQTFYSQVKPFVGIPVKTIVTSGDGLFKSAVLQSNLQQFACTDAGCLRDDTPDLMVPHLVRVANQQVDTYDDKGVHITKTKQVTAYDSYGSEISAVETISGNGVTKTTATESAFINNFSTTQRFIGVPALQRSCLGADCSGTILSQTRLSYDNQTYLQIGSNGIVTKKEIWLSGNIWVGETYGHDSIGNRTLITSQSGITTAIEYDPDYKAYAIKTTTTSQGIPRVSTQQFDPRFGIAISQTDIAGITMSKTYDGRGRITGTEIRDETTKLLRKTSNVYHVDTAGDRYIDSCNFYLSDFSAQTCSRQYVDSFGHVIREIAPTAQGSQSGFLAKIYGYDVQGRKVSESETLFSADTTGQITPARYTTYAYDQLNRVTQVTMPDGKITTTSYNADFIAGAVASELSTAPNGGIKKTYRNIDGNPIRVIEAFGTAQQTIIDYSYDTLSRLTNVTSAQGITSIGYDPQFRWQTYVDDPNVGRTTYTYGTDPNSVTFGKVLTETRPDANSTNAGTTGTTTFAYNDPWGRVTSVIKADGTTTAYTYDETDLNYGVGALTTRVHSTQGYSITDRYAYSALGETASTTRRIGHASLSLCGNPNDLPCLSIMSSQQDEVGRLQTISSPDGKQTNLAYVGATSTIASITHDGKVYANYDSFNVWGKPELITYGNGIAHEFNFDPAVGKLSDFSLSKGATVLAEINYCYDNNFNITRLVDSVVTANTANFSYDSLGRISSAKRGIAQQDCSPYSGASDSYAFDSGNSYGSKGNLVIKNNRKLLYNGTGIQPSSDQKWDSSISAWVDNQTFTWSQSGNLLSKGPANYQYNADNMLAHASEPTTGDSDFFYDADGQRFLKVFRKPGDAAIQTWYVGGGMEVRQRTSADLTTIFGFQMTKYVYAAEGQKIASITAGVNQSFAVESSRFSMLAKSFSGSSASGIISKIQFNFYAFIHDDVAKRKAYLTALLLIAAFLAYRLVRSWPARPRSAKGLRDSLLYRAVSVSMALIFISVNLNCVGRSDVEMNPLFQQGSGGSTDFTSIYAGLPVGTYYYHPDHLGSGSLITDASGAEVMRIVYDAYGNIDQFASGKLNPATGLIEQNVGDLSVLVLATKFTGQEYDPETGLYYYNARYYDPNLGQFTTADTIVPNPTSAHSYNRYQYVAGNPIRMVDPTGHWEISFGFDSNGGFTFNFNSGNGNGGGGGHVSGVLPASTGSPPSVFSGGDYAGSSNGGGGYGNVGSYGDAGNGGGALVGYFFPNGGGNFSSGAYGLGNPVDSGPYFGRSGNFYAASNDRRIMNDADPVYALETPGNHAARQAQINSNIYYAPLYKALDDWQNDVITGAIVGGMARFANIGGGGPTGVNGTKGWRVGQPINNLTGAGNTPAWSTVRQRYWKNEAFFNSGRHEPENLLRLQKGLAPQRFNRATGQTESMELHHTPPQRNGGLFDVEPLWPDEHAVRDAFRHIGAY